MGIKNNLNLHRSLLLLLIPAYARSGMLFDIRFLNYGRPHGRTGYDLFNEPIKPSIFRWLLVPIIVSIFLGWRGILLNIFFALIIAVIIIYYKKGMGCITEDKLGAMTEVTESLLFFCFDIKKDFFNHNLIFDKGNYPHRTLTSRTYKWINLIYFLYESRPVFAKFLTIHPQFHNTANLIIGN